MRWFHTINDLLTHIYRDHSTSFRPNRSLELTRCRGRESHQKLFLHINTGLSQLTLKLGILECILLRKHNTTYLLTLNFPISSLGHYSIPKRNNWAFRACNMNSQTRLCYCVSRTQHCIMHSSVSFSQREQYRTKRL